MDHADHVGLLRPGVPASTSARDADRPPAWADIGAGTGAFTLALADLLGPGARIVAVDRDAMALAENARTVRARFPATELETRVADLREPLGLGPLDGLVAANSLHFVDSAEQVAVISRLTALLRPAGRFLVVEYDTDVGNHWVPHPFSAARWPALAIAAGLVSPQPLGQVPSRWLGAIHSAMARRPAGE